MKDGRQTELARRLAAIAEGSAWFMEALEAVRRLGLVDWCIGAGAVRNLVWDHLHGFVQASSLADVDVAYFDAADLSVGRDRWLQSCLAAQCPHVPWEVTNQAGVHTWFEAHFGHPVQPLRSLESAIATWPEFATCVGVTLDTRGQLRVIAPHGLDDLFGMVVRRNPQRVSVETYRQRVHSKRYGQRWPLVRVIPA